MAQTARTNRLMHRICQDYEGDLYNLNIPINRFWGACVLLLGGYITSTQIIARFQFSSGEEADWNDLVNIFLAKSNTGNTNPRDRAVEAMRTILVFYEDGEPDFSTPEQVWTWLMAL